MYAIYDMDTREFVSNSFQSTTEGLDVEVKVMNQKCGEQRYFASLVRNHGQSNQTHGRNLSAISSLMVR